MFVGPIAVMALVDGREAGCSFMNVVRVEVRVESLLFVAVVVRGVQGLGLGLLHESDSPFFCGGFSRSYITNNTNGPV